jgi:CBS domain-containing protein
MPTSVREIMTKELYSVEPEMLLSELEWELSNRRIGAAPVIEAGKLVGIISRADIVRRIGFSHAMSDMALDYYRSLDGSHAGEKPEDLELLADQTLGSQMRTLHVHDAMTTHAVTIEPEASAQEAARLMLERRVHRVIVVEGTQPIGLVSTFDLIRLIAGDARI